MSAIHAPCPAPLRRIIGCVLPVLLAIILNACHSKEDSFSSQITGYNHTDSTIASFSVNGVWGGNATPHTGGGSSTCCLQLPEPWHSGLSVKVSWEDAQGAQHDREVPVPEYKESSLGIFNVHFLRSGEIKVFDLNGILGSPDYPLQGEEANLKPGVPNFQYPRPSSAAN
jgi:hypothetical protein